MKRIYLFLIFFFLFSNECLAFGNVFGWAWSENVGWISFNCQNQNSCSQSNYGVNIKSDGTLEGYAWSENVGWITFNESDLTGCPTPPCKAWVDLSTKKVYGWAKVLSDGEGWDGWIRLRDTNYGVWIDDSVSPAEFMGFAWSDMVVGWISFNCKNQNSCSQSNYKVYTTFTFNSPPNPPKNLTEEINQCAWGAAPQAALGLAITFRWDYSDPDGDPSGGYEIWLDDEDSFSDPKFNHKVDFSSNSYTLDLQHDDNSDLDQLPSWWSWRRFTLSLSWGKTYYWKVRAKDSKGVWSDWSAIKSFQTPSHPSPSPNFKWVPQKPTVNEVVQFCSISTGICASIISQTEQSKCFNPAENVVPCSSFSWTFENGNPSSSTLQNPTTTFNLVSSNKITLTLTDSSGFSCPTSTTLRVTYPLPKWREIPPYSLLQEKIFASLTNPLEFAKIHLTKLLEKLKSKL